MKVINFFGGPGIGKSTIAADLFVFLKKKQLEVELVTEYAKDLVYEERKNILQDQLYVLAKQNRKILRLVNKGIDFAITDSPIILGSLYYQEYGGTSKNLINMIEEVYNSYDNINFLLERDSKLEYKCIGRVQDDLNCAVRLDNQLKGYLDSLNISYYTIRVENYSCERIWWYISNTM